jgi:uncharacterized protein YyaL (SSP411 family)
MSKIPNSLVHASSPYLQQHAYNPVKWVEWTAAAFEQAAQEGKLVLVSIGYSACHWCHVMEHESFEDEEVAEVMNKHFICIKVDREERPDVDQVYMEAVQLMTQRGGWPLNCFTLPDGRPIYGGTYFPKDQWLNVLKSLVYTYAKDRTKVLEYAEKLTEGVQRSSLIDTPAENKDFQIDKLHEMVLRWSKKFDKHDGGLNYAPKFPMPNNYLFLLNYGHLAKRQDILEFVYFTLNKMAMGGIYDQLRGGFSRYSVDMLWKVPHFEKMLYDNAQLISLYSKGYQSSKDAYYAEIVTQTAEWLDAEMKNPEGGYYSALDADSEGVEGRFYTWSKEELLQLLDKDFQIIEEYYQINRIGYWEEEDVYIPLRKDKDHAVAKKLGMTTGELQEKIAALKQTLLFHRNKRVRPGLDDKQLTSWNALLVTGFTDAYLAFQDNRYLNKAEKLAEWILKYQLKSDDSLWHTRKNGVSTIEGFLEDYGLVIEAFLSLYQANFNEKWLSKAKALADYCIENFRNDHSGMFYFTDADSTLIARKMEINDNVIPASNSVMANNLFKLGIYFYNDDYTEMAKQMLANVYDGMEQHGSSYSNWGNLALHFTLPFQEIAITGSSAMEKRKAFGQHFLPNTLFAGGSDGEIPFLKDKTTEGLIYVCENRVCNKPETEVAVCVALIG